MAPLFLYNEKSFKSTVLFVKKGEGNGIPLYSISKILDYSS